MGCQQDSWDRGVTQTDWGREERKEKGVSWVGYGYKEWVGREIESRRIWGF